MDGLAIAGTAGSSSGTLLWDGVADLAIAQAWIRWFALLEI